MEIGIIGGGSLGLLFAFYLGKQFNVTIYTNTEKQAKELNHNGLNLMDRSSLQNCKVNAKCITNWAATEEMTIVAVKQYHLTNVIQLIREKGTEKNSYIFLQNGMGHLKYLNEIKAKTIYVSSVEHGAYREGLNSVEHNGIAQTRMALYKGVQLLPSTFFTIVNFPIIVENNYHQMLLNKLVANAIINPITSILRITNGELVRNDHYFSMAKLLFSEIERVLSLENGESHFQNVVYICRKTENNRSSMLKDIEAKQPTEIDAILGYILEVADSNKMDAPICLTLYHLIKGSEK